MLMSTFFLDIPCERCQFVVHLKAGVVSEGRSSGQWKAAKEEYRQSIRIAVIVLSFESFTRGCSPGWFLELPRSAQRKPKNGNDKQSRRLCDRTHLGASSSS